MLQIYKESAFRCFIYHLTGQAFMINDCEAFLKITKLQASSLETIFLYVVKYIDILLEKLEA